MYPLKFVYNVVQIFLCAYMSVEVTLSITQLESMLIPVPP